MSRGDFYQLKVKGHLEPHWSARFAGLTIESEHGEMMLSGWILEQATLHGLLIQIRDLGMPLLSVQRLDQPLPGEAEGAVRFYLAITSFYLRHHLGWRRVLL